MGWEKEKEGWKDNIKEWITAPENMTRWKEIAVKSSVVPHEPCRFIEQGNVIQCGMGNSTVNFKHWQKLCAMSLT